MEYPTDEDLKGWRNMVGQNEIPQTGDIFRLDCDSPWHVYGSPEARTIRSWTHHHPGIQFCTKSKGAA